MKRFLFLILALVALPAAAEPISAGLALASLYAGATMATLSTASMVVSGMMMAGGALSLIGNATGNAKLVKYGALISAAGGVGNLIAGAQSVASAATTAAAEEGAVAGAAGAEAGVGAGAEAGAGATSYPVSPHGGTPPLGDVGRFELMSGLEGQAPPLAAQGPQGLIDSAYADPSRARDVLASNTVQAPQAAQAAPQLHEPLIKQEAVNGISSPGTDRGLVDYLRQGSDFLNKNKEAAFIGGRMVQGAMDDKSRREAQQRAWDHEAAQRASYNQSIVDSTVPSMVNPRAVPARTTPPRVAPLVPQRTPGG